MSWHDSHGGKWSKTFCITLCMGSRKPWRHMERGGLVSAALRCRGSPPWDQLTRLVACLDLLSSSWWNKIFLSCPCHIPYSRARGSAVTRAAGAECFPACWTGVCGTGVHPVQGSRCCCAHANAALDGKRHILWFLQWKGCPEFLHHKEWANLCCIPLSWLWRGFLEKWTVMIWWSYPFPHPGHHIQNTLVVWALVCATSQTISEERVLQED